MLGRAPDKQTPILTKTTICTDELTLRSAVILEKMIVFQIVKKLSDFVEFESLFMCFQDPMPGTYPEPAESSIHPHMLFL
jgi:hypothetical protein